ncbi:transport between ER and Golgi ATPase protein [Pseudocyphellaria aurata]|nr:transport between ER and Golgi ATPase protein [Pseudocyphellaria aurata]
MFGRSPRPNPQSRQPPSGSYHPIPSGGPDASGAPPSSGRGVSGSQRPVNDETPLEKYEHSRVQSDTLRTSGGPRGGASGQEWKLRPVKSPGNQFIYGNIAAVSTHDFSPSHYGSDFYIIINNRYVLTARQDDSIRVDSIHADRIKDDHGPKGLLGLSEPQRSWTRLTPLDIVSVRIYDHSKEGDHPRLDAKISFIGKKTTETPLDQDDLEKQFKKNFKKQILAPDQILLMHHQDVSLLLVLQDVKVDLSMDKSSASQELTGSEETLSRGNLTDKTHVNFFKDPKSGIKLKPSSRRPASNPILQANFKFEDMGIGGLDKEFSSIFRRAFASRIFPPGLIEKLGIQHVKGILLFGPPGTGKTLIARRIGKMLNAREPKVINGPEVLNKYVGQSEENIRKLFADAEKEYKEKGDESGLHIIIFDELDAVCKQRGSGAGGGTGVGDSVVNQLLSKLDGVDQLNNILLIGMTNRKDMIDDALLRPGRLEVHMEISLPDEHGRIQILKIHTAKMSDSGILDRDVDLNEIAHVTKNFSGAEISGLVRSATSFALNRHVKVGTVAGVADDVNKIMVNRDDFEHAFDDVKPAFGVSEDEMQRCLRGGIIHFSPFIDNILNEGRLIVQQVQEPDSTPLFSAILHGPPGSGKTALAAKIALESNYPFIKLCSPDNMIGYNESMKIEHMRRIFDDAYKSPLSVVLMDNIERIVEWVPIGPRFSNGVLQALMVLLKKEPPKGRRLLVLATTGERSAMQQLDLFTAFDADIAVPNVSGHAELSHILEQSGVFREPARAIREFRALTKSDSVGVGIKKILLGIETAKQDQDREERFANVIARAVAQMGFIT